MYDMWSLWNRKSFSLRHFTETQPTPSLWVAVDRNGIGIFLLCGTSPKRTLHQVYELLSGPSCISHAITHTIIKFPIFFQLRHVQ